jgi:hypothetical protein
VNFAGFEPILPLIISKNIQEKSNTSEVEIAGKIYAASIMKRLF